MANNNSSNNNTESFYQPPSSNASDAESFAFNFQRMMAGKFFIQPVKVVAVRGKAPDLVVDLLPLLNQVDVTSAAIDHATVYNCTVFRLQRGLSGIIMDPVVGDIGFAAIADRDMTLLRKSREPSVPGSNRNHSLSDSIYMGGFMNAQPTEYVEFTGSGINIKSSGTVNINGLKILPDGSLQLVDGSIVDKHTHGGVARGGSNTNALGE